VQEVAFSFARTGKISLSRSSPTAGLTPAVLKWARESANMTTADVAQRVKKAVEIIEAWESGEDAPTYSQLETLAYEVYKRPLAMFFMPAPPDEPKPRAEFRSLPDTDLGHVSRETTLLIRKARAFQSALIELHGDRNPVAEPIWRQVRVNPRGDVVHQAGRVRQALGISIDDVTLQSGDDSALRLWRRAIERGGIHVFKESFRQREFSGFCLWHSEFPVILINNSTTKTRQIFSLLHELAHVMCDRSGISRFDDGGIDELPPLDQTIERFCNALAGEILVPEADFAVVAGDFVPNGASDEQFAVLAARYRVSRSVVLRRFVERGLATMDFYLAKDREWAQQRSDAVDAGGSYYNTQGAYLSEQFLREVVSRYTRRLLTKAEAADLIGVKPRNFERFEDLVLRAAAA
jgi:Zn-dependent peptidase ImmA (M78 family)/transcriptional regulator with XRE-family HTH domain